jgi:transposase InsO family protein
LARLSELSVWWIRLGIRPELIEPGKPQQNGQHERMHRVLKAETACPPASGVTPAAPPPLVYPVHFETRLVSKNSGIRWRDKWVAVSTTRAGLHVGLEEIDHGLWDVYLGPVKLGLLLEETMRIEDHFGRLRRK